MVLPANTSGALSVALTKGSMKTLVQYAHVSLGAPVELEFPHLWGRTTSVRQA